MVDFSGLFILREYVKKLLGLWRIHDFLVYSDAFAAAFFCLCLGAYGLSFVVKKPKSPTHYGVKTWLSVLGRLGLIALIPYVYWGYRDQLFRFAQLRFGINPRDLSTIAILLLSEITAAVCLAVAMLSDRTPNNNSELNRRQKAFTGAVAAIVIFAGYLSWMYINGIFNVVVISVIVASELVSVVFWFYDPIIYVLSRLFPESLKSKKTACPPTPGKVNRFAVIGCAYNEEKVIGNLVDSLFATSYPKNMYDVYIICDNCTDKTAGVVQAKGAIALERSDAERRGKGFALEWMFDHLAKWREAGNAYDAYIVLDADNLVNEKYLDEINEKLNEGHEIMQTYLGCKNPGDTWISKCYSMAYWLSNSNYQDAHARVGLSAQMGGTGMLLRPSVLDEIGWRTDSLTEDLVLTANYTLRKNIPCMWVHDAKLYDEKPLEMKQSLKQRTRWMQGHIKAMLEYVPKLVMAAIKNKSLVQLDMALYLMRPFLNFCMFIIYAIRIIGSLFLPGSVLTLGFVMNIQTAVVLLLSYVLIELYVLSEENYLRYFVWIPLQWVFTYTWYPAYFRGIVKNRELYWVSTAHSRNISIEEVHEDIQLVDARKRLEGLDNLHRLPLGQILLKAAVITNNQLEQALDIQKQRGGFIGDIVLEMRALTPDVLESYLSLQKSMRETAADKSDEALHLGNILVAAGIVTQSQLEKALEYQKLHGGLIGECLIKIHFLTPELLNFFLSVQKIFDENYLSIDKSTQLIKGLVDNGGMSFGMVLYNGGLLSKQQLNLALEVKEKERIKTGEALLKLGFSNQKTLDAVLEIQRISREFAAAKSNQVQPEGG